MKCTSHFQSIFSGCVIAQLLLSSCSSASTPKPTGYVPWGVEEYEIFGKSKTAIHKTFSQKLYSSPDDKTLYFGAPDGCSGYTGPTFRVKYDKGAVVGVQRVFIGCKETQWGPELTSEREALNFAIAGVKERIAQGSSDATLPRKLQEMEKRLQVLDQQAKADSGGNKPPN